MQSILSIDTTREQREQIIQNARSCGGGGCENCSTCGLGGGSMDSLHQPYIDGQKGIAQINAEYRYRNING